MKTMHRQRGVTLIELVVVMIIVGILTAIAVPSYRNYVLRSQRSDAKDAVLALATQQEKHYLQCNTYATSIAGATNCGAGQLQGAAASKNGWYTLTIPARNRDDLYGARRRPSPARTSTRTRPAGPSP